MDIQEWWPRLAVETRDRLVADNGDVVPDDVVAEIEAVGGPAATDPWWSEQEGSAGRTFPDEAVDWVEEWANEEPTD